MSQKISTLKNYITNVGIPMGILCFKSSDVEVSQYAYIDCQLHCPERTGFSHYSEIHSCLSHDTSVGLNNKVSVCRTALLSTRPQWFTVH